jgi:uncharacterized SAM-binding protein YcdF (DUF218 family)
MGGRDRVEAAATLAKKYPSAHIVTTSKRMTGETTTLAEVYAREIVALGVPRERVIEESESTTTETQVQEALRLAAENKWEQLVFLSSEYQLPRIAEFYKQEKAAIRVEFVSSESVLAPLDPAFAARFARVQETLSYQMRLVAEARGLKAIRDGTYQSAPAEDKRER